MAKGAKRKRGPAKKELRGRKPAKSAGKPSPKRAKGVGPPPQSVSPTGAAVLDRLWQLVLVRRQADPAISHSARLLGRGIEKVAQKFGEEAVECLIEGVRGDRIALISESADTLYHLIVLWVASGVHPDEVWAELVRRESLSTAGEKSRAAPALTHKIP